MKKFLKHILKSVFSKDTVDKFGMESIQTTQGPRASDVNYDNISKNNYDGAPEDLPQLTFNRFGSVNIDDYVEYESSDRGVDGYIDLSLLSRMLVKLLRNFPEYNNAKVSDFKYTILAANEAPYINCGDGISEILAKYSKINQYKLIPITIYSKKEGYFDYKKCAIGERTAERIHLFSINYSPEEEERELDDYYIYPVSLNLDVLAPGLFFVLDDLDYNNTKPFTLSWKISNGDYVHKGDLICTVQTPFDTRSIHCKKNGYIDIVTTDIPSIRDMNTGLNLSVESSYDLYNIYQDANGLMDKYPSKVKMISDNTTGYKRTYWISLAGISDTRLEGDVYFEMDSEHGQKLYICPQYKDNKILLVVGANSKELKLSIGDQLALLFQDSLLPDQYQIGVFTLSDENVMSSHVLFDSAFEAEITPENLFRLATMNCIRWKLISISNNKTIVRGKNESFWTSINISGIAFNSACWEFEKCLKDNGIDCEPTGEEPFAVYDDDKAFEEMGNFEDDDSCYVYLMEDVANGYYKIGISKKPEYRESTLQSEKPTIELVCMKKFPNRQIALSIEAALHKTYDEKRLRGEWFSLTSSDVVALKATLS